MAVVAFLLNSYRYCINKDMKSKSQWHVYHLLSEGDTPTALNAFQLWIYYTHSEKNVKFCRGKLKIRLVLDKTNGFVYNIAER